MSTGWIVLGVIVILVLFAFGAYNRLVALGQRVSQAFADIDVQLKQRHDLIPNLVETVKGYAKQETTIFTAIADARARIGSAQTVGQKIAANQQLETALSRLLVVVENYPVLKSSENFMRLQDELAGTENRLSVERKRYNDIVLAYNTRVRQFPSNLVAAAFNFETHPLFEAAATAKTAPSVKF